MLEKRGTAKNLYYLILLIFFIIGVFGIGSLLMEIINLDFNSNLLNIIYWNFKSIFEILLGFLAMLEFKKKWFFNKYLA